MADYGLLGGLAEGLKEGLKSYRETRYDEEARAKRAQEEALKQKAIKLDLMEKGVVETPEGEYEFTPEMKAQKQAKSRDFEVFDPTIQNELTKEALSTQEMLKRKNKDWGSFVQPGMTRSDLRDLRNKMFSGEYQIEAAGARRSATDEMIKGLQAQKLKQELTQGPKGREITAGQAETMSSATSAMAALNQAKDILKDVEGISGPVAGKISGLMGSVGFGETGKKAAVTDAQLKSRAQIIARYLEGGRAVTDADMARYEKMMPKLSDPPGVSREKLDNIRTLLANKYESDLKILGGTGFDLSGVPSLAAFKGEKEGGLLEKEGGLLSLPKAMAQGAAKKPKMIKQGSHTFILNEKTGEYE